jgi:hypothetical protein
MLASRNVTWLNLVYGDWAGIQQPALTSTKSTGTGTATNPTSHDHTDADTSSTSTPTEIPPHHPIPTENLPSLPDSPTIFPPNPSESIPSTVPPPTNSRLTRELRRLADHNRNSVPPNVPPPALRSTRSGGDVHNINKVQTVQVQMHFHPL